MRGVAGAVFVVALLAGASSGAQEAAEGLLLNFRDAELATIVEAVARATGERFVVDSSLRGRASLLLGDRVSPAEALEILHAALQANGFAILRGPDQLYRIVPMQTAKGLGPWSSARPEADSERLLTTLVRLEAADGGELARLLLPGDETSVVVAYTPTNSLIIATTAARLTRMLDVIRALDQRVATRLQVIPLRYASAVDTAAQLEELFPAREISTARSRIVADERTNSLVIEAHPTLLAEMRRFVSTIDSPVRGKGFLHVVRVLNADAEVLGQQLTALQGEGDGPLAGSSFQIVPDAPTNSLVIQALPEAFLTLAEVIAELDVIPPRIAIEVLVLEVETSRAFELGFDALIPLFLPDELGDPVGFAKIGSIQQLVSPSATSLPFIARIARAPVSIPIIGPDGLPTQVLVPEGAAQLTAAQADVKITNLMSPFLLAASGKEHRLFAGEQIPLPVSSAPTTGTPGTTPGGDFVTSSSIERKDVGVDLRVKPIALSDRLVEIELDLRVDSVDDISLTARTQIVADQSTASALGPTLRKIELGATVRLLDGAVVLLAGNPQARVATSEIGVPFLRDIPVLGNFFRSTVELERRTRLVIALQATQMHTPSDERAESIQRRLAMERHLARTAPVLPETGDPYGLLVATRETRSEAEGLAQELGALPGTARIVEWTWWDATHYDVYLVGFRDLEALGPVSISLRERGFQPKMALVGTPAQY